MNRNQSILSNHTRSRAAGAGLPVNYGPLTEVWSRKRFLTASALAALLPAVMKAAGESATPRVVGKPYLQSVTSTSIWIGWRTDAGINPTVDYGTDPGALGTNVAGVTTVLGTAYNWHLVQLTGLTPGTFYSYRINHAYADSAVPVSSAVFRFRTLPVAGTKNKNKLRFLVVGDNQIIDQPRYETILSRAKRTIESRYGVPIEDAIDVMLNVGDQVDGGTLRQYQYVHLDKVAEISSNLAFMTIIGNHETYSDTGMALYKAHFCYDALTYAGIVSPGGDLYYANLVGTVLFLHLNTEDTSTAQTNWVRQVLTAANADPSVEWIVSFAHRPYQAEQYVGDISTWIRNTIVPILATSSKYVLNVGAHHHLYARGQMRDSASYHIISGGTAWDQYWGMSTETDFDDVTKTIANWTWQIFEFDLTARKMTVECFSEAHPKLGFVYPSKLVDSFHRQFGIPGPDKPAFGNAQSGATVTLPLNLYSGAFSSAATTESLYSIQYQISAVADFSVNAVDKIVDIEDYYGDTGSPNYTPVDKNAGRDILTYTIPANSLPNNKHYARIRHRDTNCVWSAWSDSFTFTVTGSAYSSGPVLTLAKRVYGVGEAIGVTFSSAPGNTKDWIATFPKGVTPATGKYKAWNYLNGTHTAPGTAISAGTLTLSDAAFVAGTEWFAVLLKSDGYTEAGARVPFYIGTVPTLNLGKVAYATGESVTVQYANAPGGAKDWIAIYKVGQTPGSGTGTVAATAWAYVTGTSGTVTLAPKSDGFFFAVYFVNDAYYEISDRVAFSVGSEISTVSLPASVIAYGSPITVNFAGGAGTPKDYVGVFARGGVAGTNKLLSYVYVGGRTEGSVTIPDALPAGDYFLALYVNDSYTAISAPVEFSVTGGPVRPEIGGVRPGETGTLIVSLYPKPGATHRLLHSADMVTWDVVETFVAEGLLMEKTVSWDASVPVGFWKVDTL